MKKLFILTAIIATTSFIATKGDAQVFVGARVGFRVPAPRIYVGAAIPAPVVYAGGYYAAPAVCEADFPGYAYYDYPVWNGHYRDRVYFEHYRPFFYRDHASYFNHGRFDHERWGHDRGFNRGFNRGRR